MKITEGQLYNIICESINDVLMEADGPDINGSFNKAYQQKASKNKGFSNPDLENQVSNDVEQGETSVAGQEEQIPGWGQHGKKFGRNTGIGTAMIAGANIASYAASFLGAGNLVGYLCGLLIPVGLGALAMNYLGNARAMGRVSKLKLPNTYNAAFRYAKYAVAERSNAQSICLNVQQNLKNAIDAWNLEYPDKEYTWEKVLSEIQSAGQSTKATFDDEESQDTVEVDFDKNFTDKYVGKNESKFIMNSLLTEAETPDVSNVSKTIKNAAHYQAIFEKDEALGVKYLTVLGTMYIQAYSLWMKWTRYINKIVNKFKDKGLTWESLIDYNGNIVDKAKIMGANLLNSKLGTNIKPGMTQNTSEYQGTSSIKTLDIRVVEPTYNRTFTLVQALLNNTYFSIPYVVCEKGEKLRIKYSPTYIEKKYQDKRYGTVYQLNKKSIS